MRACGAARETYDGEDAPVWTLVPVIVLVVVVIRRVLARDQRRGPFFRGRNPHVEDQCDGFGGARGWRRNAREVVASGGSDQSSINVSPRRLCSRARGLGGGFGSALDRYKRNKTKRATRARGRGPAAASYSWTEWDGAEAGLLIGCGTDKTACSALLRDTHRRLFARG